MIGFFDFGTGETSKTVTKKKTKVKIKGCESCGLHLKCTSPKMQPIGKEKSKVLIIGAAPTEKDDNKNKLFTGSTGQILKDVLYNSDIDINDCRLMYAVCCKSSKPSTNQINICREKVLKEINECSPNVIIPLGKVATQSVLGHKISGRLKGIEYKSFFNEIIPDQDYNAWICPVSSLKDVLIKEKDEVLKRNFENSIEKALKLKDKPILKLDYKDKIKVITHLGKARSILTKALSEATVLAYDYETTGIKPHRKGHKIISVSVCFKGKSYAFPFFEDDLFKQLWKELMLSGVKKIAHKSDFENMWTNNQLDIFPANYKWDTCIGAKCLSNKKPTSLKYLTYINFGIIGYDESIDKFITTTKSDEDEKSGNKFNIIEQAPIEDLLYYGALDSYFTFELYKIQKEKLDDFQIDGLEFFLEGVEVLSRVQENGMNVDMERLELEWKKLTRRMNIAEKRIYESDEAILWKEKKFKTLNINSPKQLSELFYKLLQYKGKGTDESVMEKIGTTFTKTILEFKKLKKMRDTYLAQYKREQIDGILHPFFNLHIVSTFRSSSDSPNFQNIPKRNKQAKKIIRRTLRPSKGNRLIEYDYGQQEVRVGACYNHDPNMIEYIMDETTDMHRDTCMDLFLRSSEDFTSYERYVAKNGFVFPEFYGSTCNIWKEEDKKVGAGEVTRNIWDMIEQSTKDHLFSKGIRDITDFQKHIQKIENTFWNDRFGVYKDWKMSTWMEYKKKGYVDLKTGFRCYGPMKYNEVTNYPIQGSAFHCLLWTLNKTEKLIKDISGRSKIIGQIHDAIVGDIHPEDEKEVDKIIFEYGTKKIMEEWNWIIVPLILEKEVSEINGDWSEMQESSFFT
jgi:uracil-DNA glycosylase family 4